MNVAFVVDGKLLVPATSDTILDGVTRKSAIKIAKDLGIEVEERPISVAELEEAAKAGTFQEAFGLGTAATVSIMCTIGFEMEISIFLHLILGLLLQALRRL